MFENSLILGDNLEILKTLPSESVDLCYIDPPFFSNRNYEVIWGDTGEIASFQDRWSGGMEHYIGWLHERVVEIHRVLKPTGAIFVHCDWHANAYIRVNILDKIFGYNHFVNEIIWYYYNKMPDTRKKIITRASDTIFWYTKNKSRYCFNLLTEKRDAPVKQLLRKKVQGKAVNARDDEGNIMYQVREDRVVDNVWRISMLQPADKKERIGYPTQKPSALLERIITAASNEGDIVLDAFMGGGTTISAARRLGRNFIGIDQSVQAVKVSQARLERETDLVINTPFTVKVHKYDYDDMRNAEHFAFQNFIVEQFDGTPNYKKTGDFGLDGVKHENGVDIPIQVKRSDGVGRNVVDNFKSAMTRFNKKCKTGYIIAFSFGKGAVEEAARLKNQEGVTIKLIKVEDIIPLAQKPRVTLSYDWDKTSHEIEKEVFFTVSSKDEIELYQWDFNYDPEKGFKAGVLMDKEGKQTRTFPGGTHNIAVRAIDKDGIEAMEELTLIVNGGVKTSSPE